MQVSPLPFLAVGLGILGLLGLGALYYRRLNARLGVEILAWLRKGATLAEAQATLAARGIDAEYAADLVGKTIRRAAFVEAAAMLGEGATDAEVRDHLVKSGLDREAADEVVGAAVFRQTLRRWPLLSVMAGLTLALGGVALAFFGLILRDGNRTGRWVTFPYAGGTAMVAGVCVAGIGCTILYGRFLRTG